jgi:hypothetical protein
MSIKNILTELETKLADNSPDSLVSLNSKNPKRITRKMMLDIIPDMPNCVECDEFYKFLMKSNLASSEKVRNIISKKMSQSAIDRKSENISDIMPLSDLSVISETPEQIRLKLSDEKPKLETEISLNSDQKVSDAIILDAISDGIQNAVEKSTEKELNEANLEKDNLEDDEDRQDFDNDDILDLINSVDSIEKKVDNILEMFTNLSKMQQNLQSQMSEHSKKVDSMKSEHSSNVEKTAHISRVIEMMNRQEVEGTEPSKDDKKVTQPVAKKSAEEIKKEQIKRMFGIVV